MHLKGEGAKTYEGAKSWSSIITNNVHVFYMTRDVMILMRARSVTRDIEKGGP
jgi:hypothetical protein